MMKSNNWRNKLVRKSVESHFILYLLEDRPSFYSHFSNSRKSIKHPFPFRYASECTNQEISQFFACIPCLITYVVMSLIFPLGLYMKIKKRNKKKEKKGEYKVLFYSRCPDILMRCKYTLQS